MRKLKIKCSNTALLTVKRSNQWSRRMVYILAANKFHKYKSGSRSRIIYIGTTGAGAMIRPAASAVNKASQAFGRLYGVKTIEVHIATCGGRKPLKTWKLLESALIDTFRKMYFELPRYNKVRPKHKDGLFSSKALEGLIQRFEM